MNERKYTKLPISAVMVIYNEEKVLERALRSFYDLVDEIIIVHDGKCTDQSIEIAKRYTDKVFELDHVGEAERHRPFTYDKAKNDWILQMDADEYLSPGLRKNLDQLISGKIDVYEISWSTFYKEEHYFWLHKRALFKKSQVYFIGVSHEPVQPKNRESRIGQTEFVLMHEPLYDNLMWGTFKKKWRKWAKLQAKQLLEEFPKIPKWNCDLTDWERSKRIRIDHPIILGLIGTIMLNGLSTLKDFFIHRKLIILKLGVLSFLYHLYLNLYLFRLKKKKQYV